jgi:hypothetical protein
MLLLWSWLYFMLWFLLRVAPLSKSKVSGAVQRDVQERRVRQLSIGQDLIRTRIAV